MGLFDRFRSAGGLGSAPADPAKDIRDEVELYLDLRTEELIAGGLSPQEARARAERAFGDRRRHESRAVRFARRAPCVAARASPPRPSARWPWALAARLPCSR